MTVPDRIRDRLELVNGKVYWKKCELYKWVPCKIRAGAWGVTSVRIVEIDGEIYTEKSIINILEEAE